MGKQTGTGDELFATSKDDEQIAEQEFEPAVEETEEPTEANEAETAGEATEAPAEESEPNPLDDFLAKKGIKSDDPEALSKVVEMYRNVERGFQQKSQENAQLNRQLETSSQELPKYQAQATDALRNELAEIRSMRTEMEVAKWKSSKNLSPEAEAKMLEYVQSPLVGPNGQVVVNPQTGQPLTKGSLVVSGALSLDDVYRLSGGDTAKVDALKDNLRSEIRKEMAARQSATRPRAASTDSEQFAKPKEDDPFVKALLRGD